MQDENEMNIRKLRKLKIPVWVDGNFGSHFRSRSDISEFRSGSKFSNFRSRSILSNFRSRSNFS